MRIVMPSWTTENVYLLSKLQQEGHEVSLLVPPENPAYEGITPRPASPQEAFAVPPDLVVFDTPGLGKLAKSLSQQFRKLALFGGGVTNDALCNDRAFSQNVLHHAGIPSARVVVGEEIEEFTRNLLQADVPVGGADLEERLWSFEGEVEKFYDTSMIVGSEAELRFTRIGDHHRRGLVTATELLRGERYLVAALYGPNGLVKPTLLVHQERGLLQRGGPQTPETVILTPIAEGCMLSRVVQKLETPLSSLRFCGWVFLELVIRRKNDKPWAWAQSLSVEVPPGFWAAFCGGLRQELGTLLLHTAKGKQFTYDFTPGFAASARLSVPPYPFVGNSREAGLRIPALNGSSSSFLWENVRKDQDDLVSTSPELGYVVAQSETPADISRDLERAVDTFRRHHPEAQCKSNVGEFLEFELAALRGTKLLK